MFNGSSISELLELQRLRKTGAGIDIAKLNKGVDKKKPKKPAVSDEAEAHADADVEAEAEAEAEAKARKVVRTNNFTKQTNVLDVDKHM